MNRSQKSSLNDHLRVDQKTPLTGDKDQRQLLNQDDGNTNVNMIIKLSDIL